MVFFNKIFESLFKKVMNQNKQLFSSWDQKYAKDDWQETFIYSKDKKEIRFAEDLREHSIEFRMLDDSNCIIEAGYKTVIKVNSELDVQVLGVELINANNDAEELNAYLKFLTNNHLL